MREAQLTGRSLRVLYAYTVAGSGPEDRVLRDIGDAVLDAANARVRAGAPELVVESDLYYGPPVPLLLEQSKEAAVMVEGSRGAGSFAALLLGSVAVGVTAHAHCPVVVVRGPGAERQASRQRHLVGSAGGGHPDVAGRGASRLPDRRRSPRDRRGSSGCCSAR